MGKVAIVGVEGSGKTVLMAGLCECYKQVPGSDDPYLIPENQAAFKFMEMVPYALRVKRQWPVATGIDNLRAMRWTLRSDNEVIETIELLDYPGEIYRLAFGDTEEVSKASVDAKQPEIKKFLDHLIDADTLLVLLNLSDIVNLGENPKNLETVWITRGIFDYAKKLPNIKRELLVFTQADRHAAALEAAGSVQALYEAKLPMLKCIHPDLKVIAIAAVSGMDDAGRPQSDYSAAGCLEVMRYVLAEKDFAAQRYLKFCETDLERINQFDAGSAKNFSNIVTDYSNSIAELINASKPLNQLYAERVEQHEIRIAQLSDLVRDALCTVEGASLDALATSEAWVSIRERHKGYEHVFAAFLQHYKRQQERAVAEVERLKELAVVEAERQKKLALKEIERVRFAEMQAKKEQRESFVLKCVISGAIAVLLGSGAFFHKAEQARVERGRQKVEAAATKAKAAQVEAEVIRAKAARIEAERVATVISQETVLEIELSGERMYFMPIKAGSFDMGSNNGSFDEKPVHRVTLTKPFWMGRTEVTQGQYEKIMRNNPSHFKGSENPVENVSWSEAVEFCQRLTEHERKAGSLPMGCEYRLPTEAEWEYCCRAGTAGDYAGNLEPMAWYFDNSEMTTHAVATKAANNWGLYDMHGNVREWCRDWHGTYPGTVTDPSGAVSGSYRVLRGGSWYFYAQYCRSAYRYYYNPYKQSYDIGFRAAMTLP